MNVHTEARPKWYLFRVGREGNRRKGKILTKNISTLSLRGPRSDNTRRTGLELRSGDPNQPLGGMLHPRQRLETHVVDGSKRETGREVARDRERSQRVRRKPEKKKPQREKGGKSSEKERTMST